MATKNFCPMIVAYQDARKPFNDEDLKREEKKFRFFISFLIVMLATFLLITLEFLMGKTSAWITIFSAMIMGFCVLYFTLKVF